MCLMDFKKVKGIKPIRFKQANSIDGYSYHNHTNNSFIMKYKPSIRDILRMLCGVPLWVGVPIVSTEEHMAFTLKVTRKAFTKTQ